MISFLLAVATGKGQEQLGEKQAQTEWLTGRKLDLHLQNPISATWKDSPVKSRLLNFARQQKVGIFVDRRIDTEQRINVSSRNVTFEQFLWKIAAQGNWGVCRLDDFFYVGPPETTAALPILWQQMKAETRRRASSFEVDWNQSSEFETEEIFIPAEALQQLGEEHGFAITDGKLVHDVWQAVDLPNNSLDAQVALLLVGFDQWFSRSKNGKEVELIDFPTIEQGRIQMRAD